MAILFNLATSFSSRLRDALGFNGQERHMQLSKRRRAFTTALADAFLGAGLQQDESPRRIAGCGISALDRARNKAGHGNPRGTSYELQSRDGSPGWFGGRQMRGRGGLSPMGKAPTIRRTVGGVRLKTAVSPKRRTPGAAGGRRAAEGSCNSRLVNARRAGNRQLYELGLRSSVSRQNEAPAIGNTSAQD